MTELKAEHLTDSRTIVGSVHEDANKKMLVNADYIPPSIRLKEPDNKKREYRCCMCGQEFTRQKGNFYSGAKSMLWRGNGGYLPFCKSCCDILMESLTTFYSGNSEHALRHLCAMFDWYYDEQASAMTRAQEQLTRSRLSLYPSKMCTRQVATRGTTYLDTLRDDYQKQQLISSYVQVNDDEDDSEEEFQVTREMVRTWGKGFTNDEYEFLENQYCDWVTKHVCNTKSQEELFRNIALAQLDARRARERGGKVSDALKALQDLMNSANILPRQTADNVLADTQTFGTLLKKYEETDPIPEPEERWRDVDGIRRYMNTWYRGGLAKALKINNENVRLYDEAVSEMDKYTVSPPNRESESGTNDASIFDDAGGGAGGEESGGA